MGRSYYPGWTTAQIADDLHNAERFVKSRLHVVASAAAHTRTGPGLRWRSPANRRELTSGSKCDITIREMGLVRKCLERRYERMSPEDKPAAGGEMHRRAQVAAAQITAAHAALAGSAAQGQSRAEHQGWWTCRSTASPARTSNC